MARSFAQAWAPSTLAVCICACTGGPLPSTTDAIADTETGETTTDDTDTGESTTETETTTGETTTEETTTEETGANCMTPEVVGNLTIDEDTPPEGLACLRVVATKLEIQHVDWIDLSYLPALERVGKLELRDNDSMTNLSGTSLVELERLTLSSMPALTSTAGLEQLVALERLYLGGLPLLGPIDLPVGLPTVGIEVYASNLDMLAELQPQPSGVSFNVNIGSATSDIAGLLSCCAMPELNLTSYSQVLTDFTDLQGITAMRSLHVFNAGQLTGLAGLEQLESVGTLEIAGGKCDTREGWLEQAIHIESLAGLDSLTSIESLELRYLFDMQTLAGLPADATITALELRNMPGLSYAEAEAFAAATQAQDPWICGLAGDPICYMDPIEGAPCPQ